MSDAANNNDVPLRLGESYKGYTIDWEYGYYTGTHHSYDASYEGPEEGWVGGPEVLQGRDLRELCIAIDEHLELNPDLDPTEEGNI